MAHQFTSPSAQRYPYHYEGQPIPSAYTPFTPPANDCTTARHPEYTYNHLTCPTSSANTNSRSRGLDYLRDLHTEIDRVVLNSIHTHPSPISYVNTDKPLPRLPAPPPLPSRPVIATSYSAPRLNDLHRAPPSPTVLQSSPRNASKATRPQSLPPHPELTPQKYFRASAYLRIPDSPRHVRPYFEPTPAPIPSGSSPISRSVEPKGRRKVSSSIDITYIPSSSSEENEGKDEDEDGKALPGTVTNRSPARRQRATSEQPPRTKSHHTPSKASMSSTKVRSSIITPKSADLTTTSEAIRCAGFTRTGASCKRLVRSTAPYILTREPNASLPTKGNGSEGYGEGEGEGEGDDEAPRLVGRYCKDHAGMICDVVGFYWRVGSGREGIGGWIDFNGE